MLMWRRLDRLRKYAWLPASERKLLHEAVFWLGVSRAAILVLPFRRIASHLGRHMAETPHSTISDAEQAATIRVVSRIIEVAARNLPWECKCLAQALAARAMLHRRGIPSTLYLGVGKDEQAQLIAHAWLRCGDEILTGNEGVEQYAVVATFAEGNV